MILYEKIAEILMYVILVIMTMCATYLIMEMTLLGIKNKMETGTIFHIERIDTFNDNFNNKK